MSRQTAKRYFEEQWPSYDFDKMYAWMLRTNTLYLLELITKNEDVWLVLWEHIGTIIDSNDDGSNIDIVTNVLMDSFK